MGRERTRIQALCERIVLKMLEWENPYTPDHYIKLSLQDPAQDQ